MTATYVATAPGKLVLFGEYSVLEGAPALVMASSARAKATFALQPSSGKSEWRIVSPTLNLEVALEAQAGKIQPVGAGEVPKALGLSAAILSRVYELSGQTLPSGTLTLDTQAFYRGTTKLGMGSSGAITVAAWHALAAAAAPLTPMGPQTTIACLKELHSAQQGGRGSGVDLAASLLGGVVRYQLGQAAAVHPEVVGPLSATHVRPLQDLHVMPVWTGAAAGTGPYLEAFASLRHSAPETFWPLCEEMALISRAACEMWAIGEVTPLLPLVTRSMAAMTTLGEAMGIRPVNDVHLRAAAAAADAGAFYKPSGAGGGDFGLIFAASERALNRASRAVVAQGLTPMPMPIHAEAKGVRVQRQD
jgi:phosphomevalonate kinase